MKFLTNFPFFLNFFQMNVTFMFCKLEMMIFFFFYRSSEFLSPCVSSGDHLQSVYPSIRTSTSIPSRQAGMYRNGHRKVLCRRLVPHLFNGTKHRLRHFQSKYPKTEARRAEEKSVALTAELDWCRTGTANHCAASTAEENIFKTLCSVSIPFALDK